MSNWRHRTTEEAQDALSRFCNGGSVMSIPVDMKKDADIILSDVISERDALLEKMNKAGILIANLQDHSIMYLGIYSGWECRWCGSWSSDLAELKGENGGHSEECHYEQARLFLEES